MYGIRARIRQVKKIDGFWEFQTDPDNKGEKGKWYQDFPENPDFLYAPACWNEQSKKYDQYIGVAWYKKEIDIPLDWSEQAIFIEFGGVLTKAKVWVNGHFAVEHEGGFTPFQMKIDKILIPGEKNNLTVKVDNSVSAFTCPQGTSQNDIWIDWFNWGGIYREVKILAMPLMHFGDVSVIPIVRREKKSVKIAGIIENLKGIKRKIKINILDKKGQNKKSLSIDAKTNFSVEIEFNKAFLWSPESPYLYTLQITLCDNSQTLDCKEIQFGMRSIKFKRNKIFLNEKPIFMKGVSIVEDFPVFGRGLPEAVLKRDYEIMKELGVNCIRDGAYPPSEKELEIADRMGIFHFVCQPSRKSNPDSKLFSDPHFIQTAKQWQKETIESLKNHPSVIGWILCSEPPVNTKTGLQLMKKLYKETKEMDPSRPVTFLPNIGIIEGAKKAGLIKEMKSVMDYQYLWVYTNIHAEFKENGLREADEFIDYMHKNFPAIPIIIEFGAGDGFAGEHYEPARAGSEEYQAERIKAFGELISKKKLTGAVCYALFDYRIMEKFPWKPGAFMKPGEYVKGIYTRDRRPKMGAYAFRGIFNQA